MRCISLTGLAATTTVVDICLKQARKIACADTNSNNRNIIKNDGMLSFDSTRCNQLLHCMLQQQANVTILCVRSYSCCCFFDWFVCKLYYMIMYWIVFNYYVIYSVFWWGDAFVYHGLSENRLIILLITCMELTELLMYC